MEARYNKLFSPLSVGGIVFPNRILLLPMVSRLATENGHVTDRLLERYERIASGGIGAMVVEPAVIQPSRSSFNLRIDEDSYLSDFEKIIDKLKGANHNLKIGLQLIHFLKIARSGWRQKVEDLKLDEIRVIPELFASGAHRARRAGFDFVELHMAHFTTLASFLSLVNNRKDEYGGDFEGRARLPREVIQNVREAVGQNFPVGIRINGEEFIKEGNTLLQSACIARYLAQTGMDYISVSAGERFEDAEPPPPNTPPFAGTGYSGSRMSPRWWNPDGANVYLAAGIRRFIRDSGFDIPVVAAGKIRTPRLSEKILEEQKADIIGLGRALLCDPDWPIKALFERTNTIVKCAACGYCSEADEKYESVTCIQWPKDTLNAPSPWTLVPPCQAACPAGMDTRSHLEFICQGRYEEAYNHLRKTIPLPASISRICHHPCERECNRGRFDDPIAVRALERFAVEKGKFNGGMRHGALTTPKKKKKISIIGSGPAGLASTHDLAKMGYSVTIFEALSIPGGMLYVGIPEYRLPKDILLKEIDEIRELGVEIRLNSPLKRGGVSVESLKQEGYEALFIAVGAHKSVKLNIPGESREGVYQGTQFLRNIHLGKNVKMGKRVVVAGGGNVAFDAARTALRLGSEEVVIVYRRSEEEMPAYEEDVRAALAEGIKIEYLSCLVRIEGSGDFVDNVECVKMELVERGSDGRRIPVPIKNSNYVLKADMVIPAVGEIPDLSFSAPNELEIESDHTIKVDPHSLMTSIPGVFAGGDAVRGPSTAIEAIADGKRAAVAIDRHLKRQSLKFKAEAPAVISIENLDLRRVKKRSRQKVPCLSSKERKRNFNEIERCFTEEAALIEADRCLQCGMFPKKSNALLREGK